MRVERWWEIWEAKAIVGSLLFTFIFSIIVKHFMLLYNGCRLNLIDRITLFLGVLFLVIMLSIFYARCDRFHSKQRSWLYSHFLSNCTSMIHAKKLVLVFFSLDKEENFVCMCIEWILFAFLYWKLTYVCFGLKFAWHTL